MVTSGTLILMVREPICGNIDEPRGRVRVRTPVIRR